MAKARAKKKAPAKKKVDIEREFRMRCVRGDKWIVEEFHGDCVQHGWSFDDEAEAKTFMRKG